MKNKGVLLAICIIITLFSTTCISANDMNDTSMASENNLIAVETCEIYLQSTSQDNGSYSSELLTSGSNSGGTFADLQNEINKAKNRLDLTRDYTFTASDKGGITINKPLVINGNGHTISGKKEANVFEIYGSNVVLNNIKFVDCYAKHNPGGSAVYWQGDNGILTNCNFGNCNSGSNDGGAIYWKGNNGKLTNCNFVNCYASRSDGAGGAVCWQGIDGTLANCKFKNCHSADNQNNGGGAILWLSGDNGIISDCSFVNCHSPTNGGAVSVEYCNNCIVTGCSFMNCSAENRGGGIYFQYEGSLINCIFKGNSAQNVVDAYRYWAVNVINMTADKISSAMAAFKLETSYGSSDKLNIKLIDINNNDFIFGEDVSMTFNGKTYTQTTDFNGKASFELPNDLPIGHYTATISYNGNNMNHPSKERVEIDVGEMSTRISAKHDDEKMEFVATLTTSEGKPLANEQLSFLFDDEEYALSTDSKGHAKISTAKFASSRHHVEINYDGSDNFYGSQREVNVLCQ